MPRVLLYFAHPNQAASHVNAQMFAVAQQVTDITCVDLYAKYPRFNIDTDREQQRLLDHDIILFQFPLFWYSTPSIVKEWQDLVLEHGFAYGAGGTKLAGKSLGLAITAAGPEDAYQTDGYQKHALRDFLRPLEQTAHLCKMQFLTPFVLYASLQAPKTGRVAPHVKAYQNLLQGLRDGHHNTPAGPNDVLTADTLSTLTKSEA